MSKKHLFLSASMILLTPQAYAAEIYKTDSMNFDIGGNIQLGVINQDDNTHNNTTIVFDNGSRMHFAFDNKVNSRVTLKGYFEWYINTVSHSHNFNNYDLGSKAISMSDSPDTLFTPRQNYFSISDTTLGELSIGKKYGAYQAVTGYTDYFNVYSATASSTYVYGDGGLSGTGRVDNALFWSKDFSHDKHNLQVNLQAQLLDNTLAIKDDNGNPIIDNNGSAVEIESTGGQAASAIYAFDHNKFTLGVAYVTDTATGVGIDINDPSAYSASISMQHDTWYFAAVAAHSSGMYQDDDQQPFEGSGYEVILKKDIGDWTPMIGWSHITPDDYNIGNTQQLSQYSLEFYSIALNYNIRSIGFFVFIEGMIDAGSNADGSDSAKDYVAVGMYYPF